MERGNNDFVVLMLQISQLFRKQARVVVVDESDRADDQGVGPDYSGADKPVSNQVAEGLGAILVSLLGDERVETSQQIRVNRNPDAA
jgi:hypothetical protein